ncbi:SusC/RagA family TonB-linked outer membrane protein [Echinicola strongylocentroti]|uniref:SusC/RagA family TonB-linked outer membrane protein n=1 Tax=Echinicola strongylocentroti TaxID=1795355 RepID=A0A2Z4IH46_9BACT|nr:SusC/RagA family TonB-linked outer membrane protein [Echinicola strongylocentroti]AWW30481.1 SusC/RagA family TonB-linked outer membrane protein [Echinicola strongylocentroti]
MKKSVQLALLLCMFLQYSFAQTTSVTGTVTSADSEEPVPGVSILVKGTSRGAVTDLDGKYSLEVPAGGEVLIFSFIGMTTQEVPIDNRTVIDVAMASDAKELSEVVVTALGVERNRNELAYAAQEVKGDQVSRARSADFVSTLSGKVAGLDVRTNNTMGGATNVVIRGYSSISGNNQALFVIDGVPVSNANNNADAQAGGGVATDYGNAASDINPDNIASVNVLKGAAATALYGSRAANGVVMITTKKGKKNSMNISINSGVIWSSMDKSTFIRYQDQYGGGYAQEFRDSQDFGDGVAPVVRFQDDASYGPAYDPNLQVYQWDAIDPTSPFFGQTRPWVIAQNDPSTYYETGLNSNQSIAVSGGGEQSTFNLGYTRNDIKGNLPNSSIDKNMLNFSGSYDATEKLTVSASANYTKIDGIGRYGTGYNGRNPNQQFRQWWQTNVDLKEQESAYFRNKQNETWNWNSSNTGPIYSDNPYWSAYENYSNDSRDNLYGFAMINYELTDWLSIMGRATLNTTFDMQEERIAVGSAGVAEYARYNRSYRESNYDLILNFNKQLSEDFKLNGLLGGNIRREETSDIRAETNGGLVVPRLYSLSNSASPIEPPVERYTRRGVDGVYANANLGYKDMLFLELSARQDKSTTLPEGDNSYFYPAAGANFVFSEVIENAPWLTHAKARINYAEVGNDAPPLSVYDVYTKPTSFGSTPLFSIPSTRNNDQLVPERQRSWEAGVEMDFFNSLFGFDFTMYKSSTINQILPVATTTATGYSERYVNAGEMENKGIEIAAYVTPIQTNDFMWNMSLNFTLNRNKVISLYGEGENKVDNIPIESFQGGVSVNAAVDQPYGVIRGTDFIYTNEQRTVDENGYYMATGAADRIIGDPNPDWLGGINNTLTYKGVSLAFLIDIRKGGDIFSLDQWYGEGTGLYPETAGLNAQGNPSRDPVADGGGVLLPGVKEDGSPNDIYAENQDGNGLTPFGYAANNYAGAPRAMYVYDGSYVKLRELVLSYSLPQTLIARMGAIKGIDLQLVGRNLWIIHKNMEYSDPEEGLGSGNARGYQSGAYPAMRNYGFNIKLNF